jgi:hypothetical protein
MKRASGHRMDYQPARWLYDPWNAAAFTIWEKPWSKLSGDEKNPG